MSLRYFLILATCLALVLAWRMPPGENMLVRTDRELDLAIAGAGLFAVVDDRSAEVLYTRSGRFDVNANNVLCVCVNNQQWPLDASVTFPNDSTRIDIQPDGEVRYLSGSDDRWMTAGCLSLCRFNSRNPFADPLAINRVTDDIGSPMMATPGEHGLGTLQQGWREHSVTTHTEFVWRISAAFVASLLIYHFGLGRRVKMVEYARGAWGATSGKAGGPVCPK